MLGIGIVFPLTIISSPYLFFRLYGRDIASAEGYKYSKAFLDRQGIEWTEDNLRAWLKNPRSFIPKSKISFLIEK